MGRPFGAGRAGDLQFVFLQGSVAVGTDGFDTRLAELQHIAPGAGLDEHAEPAEADPAAAALVPDDDIQGTGGEQEPSEQCQATEQVLGHAVEVCPSPLGRGWKRLSDQYQQTIERRSRHYYLAGEIGPIAHTR